MGLHDIALSLGCFEFIDGTVNAVKYQQILKNSLLASITKLIQGKITFFSRMARPKPQENGLSITTISPVLAFQQTAP